MKRIQLLVLVVLFVPLVSSAGVIKVGSAIEDAQTAMNENGYKVGGCGGVPVDLIRDYIGLPKKDEKDHVSYKKWLVGQGTLHVWYVKSTGTITGVSYCLCEKRPSIEKGVEFELEVKSFEPETGVFTLQVQTPNKGEQGAGGKGG
jgi:hypothetical protein